MIPERFKVKVSQSDYDSTRTPFWSPRMIDILLAIYRWPLIVGGLALMFFANGWIGVAYWLAFTLAAFVLLRRNPTEWLLQRTAPLSRLIGH